MYADSNNISFTYFEDINDESSPINNTLTNLTKEKPAQIFWNDEPYDSDNS